VISRLSKTAALLLNAFIRIHPIALLAAGGLAAGSSHTDPPHHFAGGSLDIVELPPASTPSAKPAPPEQMMVKTWLGGVEQRLSVNRRAG
jgi:hypothetical protein